MIRSTRIAACVLLATIAGGGVAAAQPAPANRTAPPAPAAPPASALSKPERGPTGGTAADKAKRDEARRHFEQGVALYGDGNFAGALAEFEAAHRIAPASAVLYNIGLTYKALFRYPESIATLNRYLEETKADKKVTAERRAQVLALIVEMQGLLAPVTFQVMPRDANILVDGRELKLPENGVVQIPSGNHTAEISAEGHRPERREFTVAAGTPLTLEVKLAVIPKAGLVRIASSQPGTRIRVDGKDLGVAPIEIELLAGGHQLEATANGYETHRSELVVNAGQERNVDIEMQLPPEVKFVGPPIYKKWWFWTAVATAVAGGTTAALVMRPGTEAPLRGGLFPSSLDVRK